MTIRDYFNSLGTKEKLAFRRKVEEKTLRNVATFYRWMNMRTYPSHTEQRLISKMINRPVEELFPERIEA